MSFATDGHYDDDLGHGYIRRPISVGELMEREGYRPAARSRATRRALSGVAAGAVLALGAVVGSLFLNHGAAGTTGDTLASGSQSGGDIVLAEAGQNGSGPVAGPGSAVPSQSLATTPTKPAPVVKQQPAPVVQQQSQRPVTSQSTGTISGSWTPTATTHTSTSHAATTTPTPTTQAVPTTQSAPATTSTAPSTTKTTPTNSPATSSSSSAPSSSSTPTTTPSNNGGLLGTVTGTLNDLTAPVFNWFG